MITDPDFNDYLKTGNYRGIKIKTSIEIYKYLMKNSREWTPFYKALWANYYQLSLSNDALTKFDDVMEIFEKHAKDEFNSFSDANKAYESIIEEIEELTKEKHFSFASKFMHTIYPDFPIIDGNIKRAFNIKNQELKTNPTDIMSKLHNYYIKCINENGGKIQEFKANFNCEEINDVKALDFIFWSSEKNSPEKSKKTKNKNKKSVEHE